MQAVHRHDAIGDAADSQHGGLRRRDDRAESIHAEHPEIADGERAAGDIRRMKAAGAGALGQILPLRADVGQSWRVSAFGITAPTTPSFTAIAMLMFTFGLSWMALPVQLAFILGCFASVRATSATRRSVCVNRLAMFFARRDQAAGIDLANQEEVRRGGPALRGALGHQARDGAERGGVPVGGGAAGRGACASAARCTSSPLMVPPGPVPTTLLRSTPSSCAIRRAFGETLASTFGRWRPGAGSRCARRLRRLLRHGPRGRSRRSPLPPAAFSPGATIHAMVLPTGTTSPSRCLHAGQNAVGRRLPAPPRPCRFRFRAAARLWRWSRLPS